MDGTNQNTLTNGHKPAYPAASGPPAALETLFRQYVEATPLGVLVVDGGGTITFANASALACFGYRADELLGQPVETLLPVPLRENHVQLRDRYLRQPEQRMMGGRNLSGRRKDGSGVPVAVGLNPLIDGGTCRVACTVMDLTRLRLAEQDLTRFFELSPDLFCIASADGYFLRVNPNFTRVLGYPDEVLLSRPLLDFVHPDDLPVTREAASALGKGQPVVRFRNRFRDAGGGYRWFDWSAAALRDGGEVFATARDVTEQVRLEEALLAQQRRERAILDNTPAIVYVKDGAGRYEYINQQYADRFALDPRETVGKRDHEIFPAEAADQFVANDQEVLVTGERITFQELVPQDDGLHTYVSVKFPLFDAQGRAASLAGISTDITEQVRARDTREQLLLARAFQKKLYPAGAPVVAGLDAEGAAIPRSHLCGDYYDFLPAGPGRLVVALGDVSGHGIGPALSMVAVRTMTRMLLRGGTGLAEAVGRLNGMLCEDLPESSFVSLFLAEVDAPGRQLRYVGAGHEALLLPAAGGVTRLESTGPLLGIDESADFGRPVSVPVSRGDLVLFYTDGLTEAMDPAGRQFRRSRVADVAARHRHEAAGVVIQNLFAEVYEFSSGRTIPDDMTVVAVKVAD